MKLCSQPSRKAAATLLPGFFFCLLAPAASQSGNAQATEPASAPIPFADSYQNQDYQSLPTAIWADATQNPALRILSGFHAIWALGNPDWTDGRSVDPRLGPPRANWSNGIIRDASLWEHNIRVAILTTSNRNPLAEAQAYFDDRRHLSFSVLSGLGPSAEAYKRDANAFTTIQIFPEPDTLRQDDKGNGAGDPNSKLGPVIELVNTLRGRYSSSNPSKIHFTSPRPWRMNDRGEVRQIDLNCDGRIDTADLQHLGNESYPVYESSVQVIPQLLSARRSEASGGGALDGGFPSGHTNAAYLAAFALAYAFPEHYCELLMRASEIGHNRIVAGMHSPFDVIGGRTLATALASAILNDASNSRLKSRARERALHWLSMAHPARESGTIPDRQADSADIRECTRASARFQEHLSIYEERMTYGFPQSAIRYSSNPDLAEVPADAAVLLETRFPYLNLAQRCELLRSTRIERTCPVIGQSEGWGAINLLKAAGGFATLESELVLHLDSTLGGFHARDRWFNAISGQGGLVLQGTGTLELHGNSSYTGGTAVHGATLEVLHVNALGSGPVSLHNGTLRVFGNLQVDRMVADEGSVIEIMLKPDGQSHLSVATALKSQGLQLRVVFPSGFNPDPGSRLPLLSANHIDGNIRIDLVNADPSVVDPFTVQRTPTGIALVY